MIFLEQKFTMWTVYGKRLSFASETNYNYAEINALISLSVSLLCLVFGGDDKLIIAVEIRCTWIQIALGMRKLLVPKTNISLFFLGASTQHRGISSFGEVEHFYLSHG